MDNFGQLHIHFVGPVCVVVFVAEIYFELNMEEMKAAWTSEDMDLISDDKRGLYKETTFFLLD